MQNPLNVHAYLEELRDIHAESVQLPRVPTFVRVHLMGTPADAPTKASVKEIEYNSG